MVLAQGGRYQHITGTGVGGGTLLGLGRLLLDTTDPAEIDALAAVGNANGVDLALRDVITGPVGSLPPDATAVNFGRIARAGQAASAADLAAALVTMIGQVIALLAINAARAAGAEAIVVTGHMTDMVTLRAAMAAVGNLYQVAFLMPPDAGSATALGALLQAAAKHGAARP
jgi:type II pantothenate kinase